MPTRPLRKIDIPLLDGCEKIGILKSVAVTGGRKTKRPVVVTGR